MYTAGIHAGIQSLHATSAMWRRYFRDPDSEQAQTLCEWEDNHKTVVVLNGGYQSALLELEALLQSPDNPFPWCSFNESIEALNGALTAVCIVLPEKLYDRDLMVAGTKPESFTDWEWAMYLWREKCPQAR
jgi:hypothetical protein